MLLRFVAWKFRACGREPNGRFHMRLLVPTP